MASVISLGGPRKILVSGGTRGFQRTLDATDMFEHFLEPLIPARGILLQRLRHYFLELPRYTRADARQRLDRFALNGVHDRVLVGAGKRLALCQELVRHRPT